MGEGITRCATLQEDSFDLMMRKQSILYTTHETGCIAIPMRLGVTDRWATGERHFSQQRQSQNDLGVDRRVEPD